MHHLLPRRNSRNIGQGPDTLGVIERGRGIETPRRVVPRKHTTLSTERLGDRDTLPLSPRDTSDELVPDERIRGVLDVEHLKQGSEELFPELFLRDPAGEFSGRLASEGGLNGLLNRQGGQVFVVCRCDRISTDPFPRQRSSPYGTHPPRCTRPPRYTSSSSPWRSIPGKRHPPRP